MVYHGSLAGTWCTCCETRAKPSDASCGQQVPGAMTQGIEMSPYSLTFFLGYQARTTLLTLAG